MWLSVLLHLFAATALSVAAALTFRMMALTSRAGVVFGLCLYAAVLAVTFVGERSRAKRDAPD